MVRIHMLFHVLYQDPFVHVCRISAQINQLQAESQILKWCSIKLLLGTFESILPLITKLFNPGSLLYDDASVQHRVVVNTYLAICASCVTAMITSHLVHGGKLNIVSLILVFNFQV